MTEPGAESRFVSGITPHDSHARTYSPRPVQDQPRRRQARHGTHRRAPTTPPVRTAVHWQVPPTVIPSPLASDASTASTASEVPITTQIPTAVQEDSDNDSEMWNMYLDEVKEEDDQLTKAWTDDASSIVVFTGLFSAIVGAFIIEFYKKLSTDSGNQTVALLQQISGQLASSPNSSTISNISNIADQQSPPTLAIVWINILWLTSLILSLTCALIATLLQQWARKYIETPKSAELSRHRARVRTLLIFGARSYKIPFIVELLPTLLHLSVFLFFGGLTITFHTIHKTVAIAVDVAVGLSGLAYIAMSILPCLDMKCPYRTPISQVLWYPCHAFHSFAAVCLHGCMWVLLVSSRGQRPSGRFAAPGHWKYVKDGLENSIVYHGVQKLKLKDGDRKRITWVFNQLARGDRSKFLKFAASIPRHQIRDLILPTELKSLPLEALLILLRSCVTGIYSSFDEDVRKRSLSVCLHAIRHIAMGPILPDLDFMRALANTDYKAELWFNPDSFIRTASRSICALVARKVVQKRFLRGADLDWLNEVTEEPQIAIREADVAVRHQMNFKAFVMGTLPEPWSGLSTEGATIFKETLDILLKDRTGGHHYSTPYDWQNQLYEEIERIYQNNPEDGHEVYDRLHTIFPSLQAPFPSPDEVSTSTFYTVSPGPTPPESPAPASPVALAPAPRSPLPPPSPTPYDVPPRPFPAYPVPPRPFPAYPMPPRPFPAYPMPPRPFPAYPMPPRPFPAYPMPPQSLPAYAVPPQPFPAHYAPSPPSPSTPRASDVHVPPSTSSQPTFIHVSPVFNVGSPGSRSKSPPYRTPSIHST